MEKSILKKSNQFFAILFASFFSFFIANLSAETVEFKKDKFNLTINYNKVSLPGDAVFLKLKLETNDAFLKESFIESKGAAKIFSGKCEEFSIAELPAKNLGRSDFYQITKKVNEKSKAEDENFLANSKKAKKQKKSKKSKEVLAAPKSEYLLTGIPLSSYFKTGDYTIVISISPFGDSVADFKIPLVINEKEFISETIHLDAKNTAIRTNDSDERWQQIKKLNEILDTKNKESVYSIEPFEAPTKATRRTSFYADRRVFAYNNGKSSTSLHYGIDYGIPRGSEVRACADGKVVMAETRITTGWTSVIEHLPGLYSLYYHQDELKCKVGDIVKKGDLIGYSGMTGLATGPHLHWEMRLNMEAVNPDFFLGDFAFENK